jgi:uncharacterized protein (DUF952 family)
VTVLIYKILLPAEWDEFEAAGRFEGSPFDRASGFIHFSSRAQVGRTALRVFHQEPELVVLAVDGDAVAESLRWEAADRGIFPHLYAPIPRDAVIAVYRVNGASSIDDALPRAA